MEPADENEAYELRAKNGDCEGDPVVPVPPVTPVEPLVVCDPPPTPDTETFFSPVPAPDQPRSANFPAPLVLFSPEVTFSCPPGLTPRDEGQDTTLDYGAFRREIGFTEITTGGTPLFDTQTLYSLTAVRPAIQDAVTDFLGPDAPPADPERAAHISGGRAAFIDSIRTITKLPMGVVEAFADFLIAAQEALDTSVSEYAARQLTCGWFNVPFWVLCYDRDDAGYRTSFTDPEQPDAVFVPAGVAFSEESQEAANAIALRSVSGVVPCQFANEQQVVTCEGLYGGDFDEDLEFAWPRADSETTKTMGELGGRLVLDTNGEPSVETVAGEEFLLYDEVATNGAEAVRRELIISVTVPAGTVFAPSQSEANARALSMAISGLDCFIPSRGGSIDCTHEDVSPAANEQAANSSVEAVLSEIVTGYTVLYDLLPVIRPDNNTFVEMPEIGLDTTVGVRMVLPEGAFAALTREEADAAAQSFMLASSVTVLDCQWRNREVTYACDDAPGLDDSSDHLTDGLYHDPPTVNGITYAGVTNLAGKIGQIVFVVDMGTVRLMASYEKSDPYAASTPRGEFASPNSQKDADDVAAANAKAQLNCIYCNPRIEPNCPPNSYTYPTSELPLLPSGDYSYDATQGAPGVLYAENEDDGVWYIIPEPVGQVPETDPKTLACSTSPAEAAAAAESYSATPLRTLDKDDTSCRFCNDQMTVACCQPPEPGAPVMDHVKFTGQNCLDLAEAFENFSTEECSGGQISNPYEVITIPECTIFADSKEEANEQALNIAWAQLNCLFANEQTGDECPDPCAGLVNTPFTVEFGGSQYVGLHGECVVVGVEAATIEAGLYKSACSKAQADAQAAAAAAAQLVCLWANNEQTANCPAAPGDFAPSAVISVTIPEGAVVSGSGTPDANIIALKLAIMQLSCDKTNEEQIYSTCPEGFTLDTAGFVAAGSFIAPTAEAANAIALSVARASVICIPPIPFIFVDNGGFPEPPAWWPPELPFPPDGGGGGGATFFGNAMATSSDCGDDGPPPDDNRYELEASGVVLSNSVFADSVENANAVAETIAKTLVKCKPVRRCNKDTEMGDITICTEANPAQEVCGQQPVGGETLCLYGYTQSEVDHIAKTIADSKVVCCPTVYWNETQIGERVCGTGETLCITGTVPGGSIPSWKSLEDANDIAQNIANAMTACCDETLTLPSGSTGDIMYHNGTSWVTLANPGTGFWVLSHDGTSPSWIETEECVETPPP